MGPICVCKGQAGVVGGKLGALVGEGDMGGGVGVGTFYACNDCIGKTWLVNQAVAITTCKSYQQAVQKRTE